ncbi:MAG: hypothetical protein AAF799_25135 [Myxococcota bacterium]
MKKLLPSVVLLCSSLTFAGCILEEEPDIDDSSTNGATGSNEDTGMDGDATDAQNTDDAADSSDGGAADCLSEEYEWDEATNPLGPNQCNDDCECDGARDCSPFGWCEGIARGDQAFIPMGGPWTVFNPAVDTSACKGFEAELESTEPEMIQLVTDSDGTFTIDQDSSGFHDDCVLTGMDFVCTEIVQDDKEFLDVIVLSGTFSGPTRASGVMSIASSCADKGFCGEEPSLPCDWEITFDMELME